MLSETKNPRIDGKEDCYVEETISPAFSFFSSDSVLGQTGISGVFHFPLKARCVL